MAKKTKQEVAEEPKKEKKTKKKKAAEEEDIDLGIDESTYEPRLKTLYKNEVVPALMKKFGYKNIMQVPRLVKIVVNMGLGEAVQSPKLIDDGVQ